MSDPPALRVVRPYATVEEYLAAEAWSLSVKAMLLIDQEPLPPETLVRFDVVLRNGEKVIRAEGKVVRHLPAAGKRPAGLQVRFRRFGASTKELLERAEALRGHAGERSPASVAPPALGRPTDLPPAAAESSPAASAEPAPSAPAASEPVAATPAASEPAARAPAVSEPAAEAPPPALDPAGGLTDSPPEVGTPPPLGVTAAPPAAAARAAGGPARAVSAPADRDALLARLRERRRSAAG